MPKEVEAHLMAAGRKKGFAGKRLDHYVYGAMNNMGLMHGNKPVSAHKAALKERHAALQKRK